MILPQTVSTAVLLVAFAVVCWGSWANSLKLAGKWRFELLYWDFAAGAFLAGVVAALTFGSLGFDMAANGRGLPFMEDLLDGGKHNMLYAFLAGVILNAGNMLLLAGVSLAGMAVAFVAAFGLMFSLGIVSSYVIEPSGNPVLLFGGVGLVLIAAAVDGVAHRNVTLRKSEEAIRVGKTKSVIPKPRWKGFVVSAIAGVLMAGYYPLIELSEHRGIGLGPYSIAFVFLAGLFVSTFFFNMIFMNLPVAGRPVELLEYFRGKMRQHLLGLSGGAMWGAGFIALVAAGSAPEAQLNPALVYIAVHGVAIVAALWGLLAWKEFRSGDTNAKALGALMMLLYAAGLGLVSIAAIYA
jgi:glucose uptake protein